MFRDKFDFQHGTQTPKYQIDMTMACLLEGVSSYPPATVVAVNNDKREHKPFLVILLPVGQLNPIKRCF